MTQFATPPSELHSIDGPAQPGDYVAITVLGAAQVKVQAGATIQPGQRLTTAAALSQVRPLRTVQVEGVSKRNPLEPSSRPVRLRAPIHPCAGPC